MVIQKQTWRLIKNKTGKKEDKLRMAPKATQPAEAVLDAARYEKEHVQKVYEAIAPHFSSTRHKTWPVVEEFVLGLSNGSFGADVGCGNGKNLVIKSGVVTVGSDVCKGLVDICSTRRLEALLGDNLDLPYRSGVFDFVLSIAVIHHFSTRERRLAAVRELGRILRPGGKCLIFVWALEQGEDSRRSFDQQDVFVPWNLKPVPGGPDQTSDHSKASNESQTEKSNQLQRFYHMFVSGELESLIVDAGLTVETVGYSKDNWFAVARAS